MVWDFDPIDKNTPTNEAILQVLLDIRMVLESTNEIIDKIYKEVEPIKF